MEFTFQTVYDQKAIAAMAKALRKTLRRKRNRRTHIFGWLLVAVGILLTLPLGGRAFTLGLKTVVTWLIVLVLLAVLLFEDQINGYIARKRMLAGMERDRTVFRDGGYLSTTDIGTSEFHYDQYLKLVAETRDYFVFIFSKNHAQVYDKRTLSGGTVDEFRRFIRSKTGREVVSVEKI